MMTIQPPQGPLLPLSLKQFYGYLLQFDAMPWYAN